VDLLGQFFGPQRIVPDRGKQFQLGRRTQHARDAELRGHFQ